MKNKLQEVTMPHEGWSNKPTWAVKLCLDNDEGTYRFTNNLVHEAAGDVDKLSQTLQDYCDELMDAELSKATLAVDLLQWALAHVNWRELAESYIEEYKVDNKGE